jgi:hypothetical protein
VDTVCERLDDTRGRVHNVCDTRARAHVCITHKPLLSFLSPYQRMLSRWGYAITSREYRRRRKACRYRAHFRYLCAIIQRGVINPLSRGDANDISFRGSIQAGNKTDTRDERASLHLAGQIKLGADFCGI